MAPDRQQDEERRQLRPYRRFLAVILGIAILAICTVILRGIIRTLDRLPSTESMHRLDVVDVRALKACAEDLGRLELRVRETAASALAAPEAPAPPEDWDSRARDLETERLQIVARCRLDEPGGDPAMEDLARAAGALESLLRTYTLLHERYQTEGRPESAAVRDALGRVRRTVEHAE